MPGELSNKRQGTRYPGVYFRVSKRKGKSGTERVYYVTYWQGNSKREVKVGRQFTDDMTEARAAGIRARLIENEIKPPQDRRREEAARPTIARLWSAYNTAHTVGRQPLDNKYLMNHLAGFLDLVPSQITTVQLETFRDRLLADGKSAQTVKHVLGMLQRLIRFGVKRDLCDAPTRLHFPFPHLDNKKTECLTPQQIEKLLKALDADYDQNLAALVKLALFTGTRKSALLHLQWTDLDFERGFIRLRGAMAKNRRTSEIPMSSTVRAILEGMYRTSSPYLFPGRGGSPRSNIKHFLARIQKAAELPEGFRPLHGLRHTFASMLASSGQVDLFTLQKLLTHESPQMTQRYAHLADEAMQRAAGVAEKLFEKKS